MAIPSFVPLIGSSFDALAGQQAGWAGFNRNVEEGNLQRAAAAEIAQNRWLQDAAAVRAQAQQQDLTSRLQADAIARNAADVMRQEAEQRRQFQAGIGLERERIKAEDTRTAQMAKTAELNLQLQQHAANQKIESQGEAAASSYLMAKNTAEAAANAHEKIQAQIEQTTADQQTEMAKKVKDPAKLAALSNRLKGLNASLATAAKDKVRTENAFQSLSNQLTNRGFAIDLENEAIVHPDSGKKWTFKGTLDQAKANFEETSPGSGWMRPVLSGATPPPAVDPALVAWAGFNPRPVSAGPPGLQPVPLAVPAPPPGPVTSALPSRVGRFTIVPQ
jgi:hypothetical protein